MLVHNIGVLATPLGKEKKAGRAQGDIALMRNAHIVIENGLIQAVGQGTPPPYHGETVDAGGCLATPGLVDAHTHLVFGGWRADELPLKLRGVPYLDILKSGGGILSTVRKTRAASPDGLKQKTHAHLNAMLRLGVTTAEAKSGYGLNMEDELKQLQVVRELNQAQPVELVSTCMAAHALPPDWADDRQGYVDFIIHTLLPRVRQQNLAEFCDVFCEEGVFDAGESLRILRQARALGFFAKIHTDEIHDIGGTRVAEQVNATSAEHLIAATDEGMERLKRGGVIACLLPQTSLYLDKPFARGRDMVEKGIAVAVGSDFNPGSCPGFNMQLAMNLACWKYKLLPEEVLTAVTLNGACAVNRGDTVGTVEAGKQADLVIWQAQTLPEIFYRFGENLVHTVIKKGQVVVRRGDDPAKSQWRCP